jgi:hypothetical protein
MSLRGGRVTIKKVFVLAAKGLALEIAIARIVLEFILNT